LALPTFRPEGTIPTIVPSKTAFHPPLLWGHRHLQSVLGSVPLRRRFVRRRARALLEASERHVIDCGEGVRLETHVSNHPDRGTRTVLAIHGWHGSADSSYVIESCGALFDAGFDVVRINLRDHGGTSHLNREMFHSCRLDEVVNAAEAVRSRSRDPLLLLGFSLGANFVLRIARTRPDLASHVLAVCPVLEPAATMQALDNGWFGYRIYFMRKWRRALVEKAAAFPELYHFDEAMRLTTITELTDLFVAEHTNFPSTRAYLDGYAITGDYLADLRVPSRILLARDDPVIPVEGSLGLAAPPSLELEVSEHGGHCGFIRDLRLRSWLATYALNRIGEGEGR
jgi:predicted alpha/beta-fold hydrolase